MEADTKPSKKLTSQLTSSSINNVAPVKKILDEFRQKNSKAYGFYIRNVKQRRRTKRTLQNYHFIVPGYPLNAFDADWDGKLDLEYFETFQYKSHPPKMITALKNIDLKDPVTRIMLDKLEWHRENRQLTSSLKDDLKHYESLNEEVVQCPKYLVDLAAQMENDPDCFFDSSYNWYYAGNGNLQLICIDWLDYLLHSELTVVYLSEFSINHLAIKPDPVAYFDCGNGNYIHETIYSSENVIVVRTKHKIFILKLLKSCDIILIKQLKCIGSELPYTGIHFDDYHKNILYITTIDQKLSIINLDRLKARNIHLKVNLASLMNNWNTVIGTGRGYYTHVGGNVISIYDKRSNNALHTWKDLRNITDYVTCNDISAVKHIEDSTSLYFTTDHHLFLMDLRSLPCHGPKVLQRWMHGMECIPTYMNYSNFVSNKDLICLSSQWHQDMCVVPTYKDQLIKETNSGGVTIPYRPPHLIDTLNAARYKMLCHNLYNPIDERLYMSITGNLIIEQDEMYLILMQNSLGDISYHRLFPDYMESYLEDDSAQNLHEWSSSYILEKKDFEVTTVKNISNLLKELKKVPDDFRIEDVLREEEFTFNEHEVEDAFENEDIDIGLQEVWVAGSIDTHTDDQAFTLEMNYSEEESDKEN